MKLIPEETPIIILAEGCFGAHESKTGLGVIRYGKWPVLGVIDSTQSGKTVRQVAGIDCDAPIIGSIDAAMELYPKPKALLVGTAPMGGGLPESFRTIVRQAIAAGLHVISGLHIFLNQQTDLKRLAEENNVMLWDVREVVGENVINQQLARPAGTKVITMVGSDCSVGKMTAALEINRAMQQRGASSEFVATGQTGIMISGAGVPLDRAIGDFMAGLLEREILRTIAASNPEWVIVEGQGSLLHPAYSGVTISLIHGSAPEGMVLCHNPKLKTLHNFDKVPIPPLSTLIEIYESAAGWLKPAKVHGICLNTASFSDTEAQTFIEKYHAETGLPVTDPVRYGVDSILDALFQVN
jgi:uncharacterized NAD-dependent epimerase/dehydratase family protein